MADESRDGTRSVLVCAPPALKCLVYAAGGHARVVAECVRACGVVELAGFVDDAPGAWNATLLDLPIRGPLWIAELVAEGAVAVALGLGDNVVRSALADKCTRAGARLLTVVHPSAVVSPSARLGEGCVVLAGAVVNAGARVGAGVIVNTGAIIEHDAVVGDYAHVCPRAVMAGGSRLGDFSQLGVGAVVIDDVFVGARTLIGAGAVVTRHLGDDLVAYGVPAKARRSRVVEA